MKEMLTQAAVSDQPLEPEERELLDEVYARLDIFEQGCRPYHDYAKEAREILRLRDPQQDDPKQDKPMLQLQTLKSTFNNCVADQVQNLPEPHLLPETPALAQYAEDLQDMVHHVLYSVNKYEQVHRRRAEDMYGTGTAVTQITWDETMHNGRGDVAILRWPVEAFLWDPQAESIQDARALIKVSWHPLSWYRERYPEQAPYINSDDGQYNEVGMSEAQRDRLQSDEERAMLLEYWYRRFDPKTKRYTISVAYCAGGALLEHTENVFMHGMYPFVLDVHSTIEGMPVGDGMVGELVPMMRYINRYAHYIDTNLRFSSKGRLIARNGSGIDRKALADWSQDIVEGEAIEKGRDWDWLQHQPFNGLALQQMVQMQNDLKMDSGANQFTRGEITGGVVSGKGISALQEAGGKITRMHTSTLNAGLEDIVTQMLWLMAEFYDKDRTIMITGREKQGTPNSREIRVVTEMFGKRGKGEVAPPPYTVQIEVSPRSPAYIQAQNEMFMQAYTMAAQAQQFFPLSALFELMNIPGKDRLMPVIRENERHMQQMQQMQQQLEQTVAQMQQLQQENESLRTTASQMTNALANIGATNGGGFISPQKTAQAGGEGNTQSAFVDQARINLMESAAR